MNESMRILLILSILFLRFTIVYTQGQYQYTIDTTQITEDDSNSMLKPPSITIPTTAITNAILSTADESTVNGTTNTRKKASIITLMSPGATRLEPPINLTWIIIVSFAGALTILGVFSVIAGLYTCYTKSRPRTESFSESSTDRDDIPLYIVSSF